MTKSLPRNYAYKSNRDRKTERATTTSQQTEVKDTEVRGPHTRSTVFEGILAFPVQSSKFQADF